MRTAPACTVAGLALAMSGCAQAKDEPADRPAPPSRASLAPVDRPPPSTGEAPVIEPLASDGTPRQARLSIPRLGVAGGASRRWSPYNR